MERQLVEKDAFEKNQTANKQALETGCYLGFFVSGAMVLSRINDILQGTPHIVALEPRHIFVPQTNDRS